MILGNITRKSSLCNFETQERDGGGTKTFPDAEDVGLLRDGSAVRKAVGNPLPGRTFSGIRRRFMTSLPGRIPVEKCLPEILFQHGLFRKRLYIMGCDM